MKYTEQQKKQLKDKGMNRYSVHNRFVPEVKIEDGYWIVESKINTV